MAALAFLAYGLLYLMWKYLFLWQLDQPASGDTGGLFFPKAIQHTMVGLYIQQVTLMLLFFLNKSIPEGAVMAVLVGLTALAHIIINNSFNPLLYSLPLTFANRSYGTTTEEEDDLSIAEADAEGFGGDDKPEKDNVTRRRRTGGHDSSENIVTEKTTPATDLQKGSSAQASNAYGASVPTEGKRNEGPTDFNHPATVEPQRIIWLPQDGLGLAELEVQSLAAVGVIASTENATLDEKGKTSIQGYPPGADNVW